MKRASRKISQWVRTFVKEDFDGEVTVLDFGTPPHYHITGVGVGRFWLEMMSDNDHELKRLLVLELMKPKYRKVTNPKRLELRKWLYAHCHSYSAYIAIYHDSRRKPDVWDRVIRVGIDWLRDHAKSDPELMTALVLEEL